MRLICRPGNRLPRGAVSPDRTVWLTRQLTLLTWLVSLWICVHAAAASTFTNSIYGFAGPFLTFQDARYYLTGSLTGNIQVVSATSLAGLRSGTVSNVYSVGPGVFAESP